MSVRRSSRLSEKEVNSKRLKLSSIPIIQDGPLFEPQLQDVLYKIVNELDPRSFVRFARTCRHLHGFCFSTKGIKIKFWEEKVNFNSLEVEEYPSRSYNLVVRQNPRSLKLRALISLNEKEWICRRNKGIKNLTVTRQSGTHKFLRRFSPIPFVFTFEKVYVNTKTLDVSFLEEIRKYFANFLRFFRRVEVVQLYLLCSVDDLEALLQFAKDFNVRALTFAGEKTRAPIPPEALKLFSQKLHYLNLNFEISEHVILNATVKTLRVSETLISKRTFKDLIQKYINGLHIKEWVIGRPRRPDEGTDPFIEAISEIGTVSEVQNVDVNSLEPGIFYFKPETPTSFHFLKSDRSVGGFIVNQDKVVLGALLPTGRTVS